MNNPMFVASTIWMGHHIENLQLLHPNCNRVQWDRDMAYSVERVWEG